MSNQTEGSNETSAATGPLNVMGSIAFVFFCGPYIYHASIEGVKAFVQTSYGFQGAMVEYFWVFMVAAGSYGFAKFAIFLILSFGVFSLAQGRGR